MRNILFYINFGIYMIYSMFCYIKLKYLYKFKGEEAGKAYAYNCAKRWAKHNVKVLKANIIVEGKENIPDTNCLFISNHQGYFDIPLVIHTVDKTVGFVAKKEMGKVPVFSDWMRAINCVFMDRDNPRNAIKSIGESIELLQNGKTLMLFPEGTRSKSREMAEFRKGSLKIATRAGVPVVPVTLVDTFKVYEENGITKKVDVKIIFHKPINVDELNAADKKNISELIYNTINESIET